MMRSEAITRLLSDRDTARAIPTELIEAAAGLGASMGEGERGGKRSIGRRYDVTLENASTTAGVQRNTDAFNRQIDKLVASGVGGELIVPGGGSYDLNPIVVPEGTVITGDGRHATTLRLADGADDDLIQSASWSPDDGVDPRILIRHLSLEGNSANNAAGRGLALRARLVRLFDIQVQDFPDDGIRAEGESGGSIGHEWQLLMVRSNNNGGYGFNANNGATDGMIDACVFGNNELAQVRLAPGTWQIGIAHLYAGATSGGTAQGLLLESCQHLQVGILILENIPHEAIVFKTNASTQRKGYQFGIVNIRDAGLAADDTYDAIYFDLATGTVLRHVQFSNLQVHTENQSNRVRNIFNRGADGAVHLNVGVAGFRDYGTSILGSGLVSGTDRWQFGNIFRNNFPLEEFGQGTIANGSTTEVVTHHIGTSPQVIIPKARGSEDIWVSARDSTTFTVERAGSSGALNFDWHAWDGLQM